MHTAEMLARLNPATVRFDVGRGGLPELTAQDVAAAVAAVPAGIGRDLMCFLYWPDQVAVTPKALDRTMFDLQLAEHSSREMAMYRALAAVACEDHAGRKEALARQYSRTHLQRWPKLQAKADTGEMAPQWALIRVSVLDELKHPKKCPDCEGEGAVTKRTDGVITKRMCERCAGSATVRQGTSWRAKKLKLSPAAFCDRWASPYEWMYTHAKDELSRADRSFYAALR